MCFISEIISSCCWFLKSPGEASQQQPHGPKKPMTEKLSEERSRSRRISDTIRLSVESPLELFFPFPFCVTRPSTHHPFASST